MVYSSVKVWWWCQARWCGWAGVCVAGSMWLPSSGGPANRLPVMSCPLSFPHKAESHLPYFSYRRHVDNLSMQGRSKKATRRAVHNDTSILLDLRYSAVCARESPNHLLIWTPTYLFMITIPSCFVLSSSTLHRRLKAQSHPKGPTSTSSQIISYGSMRIDQAKRLLAWHMRFFEFFRYRQTLRLVERAANSHLLRL